MSGQAQRGIVFTEPEIFGRGSPGQRFNLDGTPMETPLADPAALIPAGALRGELTGFPELSESEVVRHYTRMSQWNFCVDTAMYPLGSCTMKYNPKINEAVARLPGLARLHPLQGDDDCQGTLKIIHELGRWLLEITGLDAATLGRVVVVASLT